MKSKGAINKEKQVKRLLNELKGYRTLAIAELSGLPSDTYERIRKVLRNDVKFFYTNKVVIYRALLEINKNLADVVKTTKIPLLIATDMDPFKLASILDANKDYINIKAGQIAMEDIVLPAGPTPFPPGPMLSQFSSIGVKTKTEGGKISIVNDTVVIKKGEVVNEKIASILSSMEIKPNIAEMNVVSALSSNILFPHDLLYRPREAYYDEVKSNFIKALNLSINVGILNKYSIIPIIKKIYIGVKFLSVNRNIISKSTIKDLLSKAALQAASLQQKLEVK